MAGQSDQQAPQATDLPRDAPAAEAHAETMIVDSDTHREPAEAAPQTEALPASSAASPSAASSSLASSAQPELPAEMGRYRVERLLGRGAMGAVFLAHDMQLNRPVALKVPSFGGQPHAGSVERFLREARAAATLCHPNICPIHDVGEHAGTQFISMGYIAGRPLSEYIASGKSQPERQVAVIVRKLALALHEAHERGIIHRDLKPANIMVDHRNEPIVMDFGLARAIDDEIESRLTREGTIVGTPAYMAPEQLDGAQRLGPATDVYALGVVLYELLAGKRPFSGSVISVIGQILHAEPPKLEELRPDVSPALAAICRQAMAKKPAERFPSMNAFADALTNFLKGKVETAGSFGSESVVVPPRSSAGDDGRSMPSATRSKPMAKSKSSARRRADWWEADEALPAAPPGPSASRKRRKARASGSRPAVWLAGGALLGIVVVGSAVLALLQRDADQPVASGEPAEPAASAPTASTLPTVIGGGKPAASSAMADPVAPEASAAEISVAGPPPPQPGPSAGEPPIARKFAALDRDGDGRLDRGELELHVLRRADADADGSLTPEELVAAERRLGGPALWAPPSQAEEAALPGIGQRPPPRGGDFGPSGGPRPPGPRRSGGPPRGGAPPRN